MKKWFLAILCVMLLLAMVACGEPAPTTGGTAPSGTQQTPTEPDFGQVDVNDPNLSAYEKEYYTAFYEGFVVSFKMENVGMDISVNKEAGTVQLVLHQFEEDDSMPTLDGNVKGNFLADYRLLFQGKLETAADGTVTCRLQEHKMVLKWGGDLTGELVQKYLDYLKEDIGIDMTQQEYDAIEDLMLGEVVEDTMFLDEEDYMVISAKPNGDTYTDIRVDAYSGEESEGYFLVMEDAVQLISQQGEAKYINCYSLSGQKLYEEYSSGDESMRKDYIYSEDGRLMKVEGRHNGELIATEEYAYDASGNLVGQLRYQYGRLTGEIRYNADGEEILNVEYDPEGNIDYGFENTYDAEGNLTQKVRYWGDGVREIQKFDKDGNQISTERYDSEGNFLGGTEYVYNETGALVQETHRYNSGAYYVETYDDQGRQLSWMDYDADGNLISGNAQTYGEDGELLTSVSYNGQERTESVWDENGNLLSHYRYYQDEAVEWELNTYNEAGQITSHIRYGENYYNGEIELDQKQLYFYDDSGLLIRLDIYYYEDSQTPDVYETYTYDAAGNQLCNYRYEKDGSLWGWNEYTYDEAGRPLTWYHYRGEGSDVVERREEWKYNAAGECISNLAYDSDGQIIMGFVREYNEDGILIRSYTYDQWNYQVTEYNEDHTYATRHVYDREGNLQYWLELIIEGDTIVDEIWHDPE